MKPLRTHSNTLLGGLLALIAGVLLGGCASTDDSENVSERPWNAPKTWEHGLPGNMLEGR